MSPFSPSPSFYQYSFFSEYKSKIHKIPLLSYLPKAYYFQYLGQEKYGSFVHFFIHSFNRHFGRFPDRSTLSAGNTTNKIHVASWRYLLSFVTLTKKVNLSREVKKGFPKYRWTFILEVMVAIIRVLRRGVTLPSLLYKVNLELAAVAKN